MHAVRRTHATPTPASPLFAPCACMQLWQRLFPKAQISFIEGDGACAEKFRSVIEATGGRLYVGLQADAAAIAQVTAGIAGLGRATCMWCVFAPFRLQETWQYRNHNALLCRPMPVRM